MIYGACLDSRLYVESCAISQWIVDCEIKKRAENQHRCKSDKYSEPIRQLEINAEHDHRKRPKRGEVSLSEIDDVCGPINEHESKRDQGINTADAEAGEEELEGYAHRHCSGQRIIGFPTPRASFSTR
jgi:hypothetical protein